MEEPGTGRLVVRGLREEFVETPGQALRLLSRGIAARRTAETRLNAASSRSHSIFTLCTHIKEEAANGDDLIKLGKLNLVDLAGSENVSRSGARDVRAREAGNINQSLLTLGRVINALVDGGQHVPYRCAPLPRRTAALVPRVQPCNMVMLLPPHAARQHGMLPVYMRWQPSMYADGVLCGAVPASGICATVG